MTKAVTVMLLLALTLAGCGISYGEAYLRSFHAAKRAYNAGRYEEAADLYAKAAQDAKRVKDRDEAYFLQARMYLKLEHWDRARATFATLAEVSPNGPRTKRAVYDQAFLQINHGNVEAGWTALERALRRYPNHGSARRALALWTQHQADDHGEDGLRDRLARWVVDFKNSELLQDIEYAIAMSHRRSGDLARARKLLLRTARAHPYPRGTLTDDAYWHASHIAEEQGEYQAAIADLRELLSFREVAQGGSYERARYPQSQMRIAELYRDRLNDPARARREFRKTYDTHTTSILADDAIWQEGLLAKGQGDTDDACDLAEDITDNFPESRYTRCVQVLCPSAPTPKRPCPDYLLNPRSDDDD